MTSFTVRNSKILTKHSATACIQSVRKGKPSDKEKLRTILG